MFFRAFTTIEGSPLPNALTFAIEHQTSQVLASCDISALQRAVDERVLPELLFQEVEFFGTIPRNRQEEVKQYFQSHAKTLYEIAQQLLVEPDNESLRNEVQEALFSEDELRRMIEAA